VQNNNISKGIECVKETMPASKYRDEIIDFIVASDKGVIRGMI
jgi:UDP-N-acetylglucosamine acyltransferase